MVPKNIPYNPLLDGPVRYWCHVTGGRGSLRKEIPAVTVQRL